MIKKISQFLSANKLLVTLIFVIFLLLLIVILWAIRFKKMKRKITSQKVATVGIFSALAVVLYFLDFPLPIFPSFLKINFSLLPIIILSFMMGGFQALTALLIRMMIKLPFSQTFCIGEVTDFLIGTIVCATTSFVYSRRHTKKGAVLGLVLSACFWIIGAIFINWLISVPFYVELFFGSSPDAFIASLKIIPGITAKNYMARYLLLGVAPFNLLLALVVDLFTFLVYKKTSVAFKKFYEGDFES